MLDIQTIVRFSISWIRVNFSISCAWYSISSVFFDQLQAQLFRSVAWLFQSVIKLWLIFDYWYAWLFRSVYIRSAFCFIQSVVHVTFSINWVWYSISFVFYLISCTCDFFDQLCLIFNQLGDLLNQLYVWFFFRSVVIFDQLSVSFNHLYVWLFRSVVIYIRSVECFIRKNSQRIQHKKTVS